MENGDTEKYHPSSVIQDFVFSSRKSSCIRCISLQVYNKNVCPIGFLAILCVEQIHYFTGSIIR